MRGDPQEARTRLRRLVLEHLGRVLIDETDRALLPAPQGAESHSSEALALQAELASIGHTLDTFALGWIDRLADAGEHAELGAAHAAIVGEMRRRIGAHVHYRPLFRNFPAGVPDDTDYLLARVTAAWVNHIGAAWVNERDRVLACGHFINPSMLDLEAFGACPICQRQDPAIEIGFDDVAEPMEGRRIRVVAAVTPGEIARFADARLALAAPLHPGAREIVEALYGEPHWQRPMPANIALKENVAVVAAARLAHARTEDVEVEIARYMRSATDVLRLAAALGASDPSLGDKMPLRLSNAHRRIVLGQLERQQRDIAPEMMRRRSWFLHLGKRLHVGANARRFPSTGRAFDRLRNAPETIEKRGARIERAMHAARRAPEGAAGLAELLASGRYGPGEFARRIDFMLRNTRGDDHAAGVVAETFERRIAHALETPLLLTLLAQFRARGRGPAEGAPAPRLMVPKGQLAKMHVHDDTRAPVDPKWCAAVEDVCARELRARFARDGAPLGRVWVDPELAKVVLPLDLRAAGEARQAAGRGTRLALDPTPTVRLFLWWRESDSSGRVDVDLSAVAYDDEWRTRGWVDYTSLATDWGTHSGDLQSAPQGAAEFIDIDVERALASDVRYVLMCVISFTGQPFSTFAAHAGAMGRERPAEGRRLDPSTVTTKFNIQHDGVTHLPVLLDLAERELLWADLSLGGGRHIAVGHRDERLGACARAVARAGGERPTFHDLVALNVEARGERANDDERATAERAVTVDEVLSGAGGALHEWTPETGGENRGRNGAPERLESGRE